MTKHFRLQSFPTGQWQSMNEAMFDYNVLATLNRLTRTGDWVTVYQVARMMYRRPNTRTFQNVRVALEHARERRQARAGDGVYQIRVRTTKR